LHGVVTEQFAPIVNTVPLLLTAAKSPNWLAIDAPEPPLPGVDSSVHPFSDVQPYKLAPAGALSRKNIWPALQTDGKLAPDLKGAVELAVEKSTSLL